MDARLRRRSHTLRRREIRSVVPFFFFLLLFLIFSLDLFFIIIVIRLGVLFPFFLLFLLSHPYLLLVPRVTAHTRVTSHTHTHSLVASRWSPAVDGLLFTLEKSCTSKRFLKRWVCVSFGRRRHWCHGFPRYAHITNFPSLMITHRAFNSSTHTHTHVDRRLFKDRVAIIIFQRDLESSSKLTINSNCFDSTVIVSFLNSNLIGNDFEM